MNKSGTGNSIIIYTLEDCIYCNELVGQLGQKNIPIIKISIDYNQKLGDILEEQYQTKIYPIIKIGNKVILRKTNLAPQNNIIILDDIQEIINKIYEIQNINN